MKQKLYEVTLAQLVYNFDELKEGVFLLRRQGDSSFGINRPVYLIKMISSEFDAQTNILSVKVTSSDVVGDDAGNEDRLNFTFNIDNDCVCGWVVNKPSFYTGESKEDKKKKLDSERKEIFELLDALKESIKAAQKSQKKKSKPDWCVCGECEED